MSQIHWGISFLHGNVWHCSDKFRFLISGQNTDIDASKVYEDSLILISLNIYIHGISEAEVN